MRDNTIQFPNITLNIRVNEEMDRVILELFPRSILLFPQGAQSLGYELLGMVQDYFGDEEVKVKVKRRRTFFRLSLKASVTKNNMCLIHSETREIVMPPCDAAKFGTWLVESFSAQLNAPRYPTVTDFLAAIHFRIMNTIRRK